MKKSDVPFFSVLIPVYNAGKDLHRCIDSVLNQTFRDFELVLCDDKSTDDSLQRLEEYAAKDSRVRILRHEVNQGRVKTHYDLNHAACAPYAIMSDDDDELSPDFLEKGAEILKKEPWDVLVFPCEMRFPNKEVRFNPLPDYTARGENMVDIYLSCYGFTNTWWSKIYRSDLLKIEPLTMENLQLDDVFFLMKVYYGAKSFRYVNQDHPAYIYYGNTGQWSKMMFNMTSELFEQRCKLVHHNIYYNLSFLKENNFPEAYADRYCVLWFMDEMFFLLRHYADNFDEWSQIFRKWFLKDGNILSDGTVSARGAAAAIDRRLRKLAAELKGEPEVQRKTVSYSFTNSFNKLNNSLTLTGGSAAPRAGENLPLVSFLIPVFCTPEKWFREMIESIIRVAQKYGNSEIIIHDDASEDPEFTALQREYRNKYPELIRLSGIYPNARITLGRQVLLERASGKYMLSFDHDDIMLDFDLAGEIRYLEAHPEIAATYSRKYFFHDDYRFDSLGALPYSPFVSSFSMTGVTNGAIFRVDALKSCGGYANIPKGLGDDVILFARLNEYFRCEMRPEPRLVARKHPNAAGNKMDYAGYEGYAADVRNRLLRHPYEGKMLENFQLPQQRDFQNLALGGGIYYLRQQDVQFAAKFLPFMANEYPEDYGLQRIYLAFLLNTGNLAEFEKHWQKLDCHGEIFPAAGAEWLSCFADVLREAGHPMPRLEEVARQNHERLYGQLPPLVAAILKK